MLGHAGEVLVRKVFLGQFRTEGGRRFLRALPRDDTGDGVVRAERCDQLRFELKAGPFGHLQGALALQEQHVLVLDGGCQPEGRGGQVAQFRLGGHPRFRSLDCSIDRRVRRLQGECTFHAQRAFHRCFRFLAQGELC